MSIKNETSRITRRNFVGLVGAAGLGAASAAVFGAAADPEREVVQGIPAVTPAAPDAATAGHEGHMAAGEATPGAGTPATGSETVDEMDAMHEEGIKAFPAPTEGLGGQPLEFELDGDVKVFRLTCDVVSWE
ncbi:MAG TPA: hypothetical protein PKA95_07570, partial [Thermomicrobiales bacterium]|nr:hypothetical protein [Thermomicrobiales bacterium]